MDVDVAEEVTVSDVNLTIKDDESEQDDDEEEDEGEKWRKKFPSPKNNFSKISWNQIFFKHRVKIAEFYSENKSSVKPTFACI